MSAILDYKCPQCGGNVKYNSSNQQFMCESCSSSFPEETLNKYKNLKNSVSGESNYSWKSGISNEEFKEINNYICNSCGAEIIVDSTTVANSCPYCGSTVVLSDQISGIYKPDFIIPFKLDKKIAQNALKRFYRGKWLLPNDLKKACVDEIKSVYVPFWLFNCGTDAKIVFDAVNKRYWSDSNYNYEEISHYNVYRFGTLDFANIPVDGSSKIDDNYMEGLEPYDFSELIDFNPAYLSGYLADK